MSADASADALAIINISNFTEYKTIAMSVDRAQ